MKIFKRIGNFIKNPDMRAIYLDKIGLRRLSDDVYLKHLFKVNLGYDLNLENPQTFNEKLQWLKLYDRKPEYTTMVDKYAVKKYVADKIGEQYIIPTLGVWDTFDDIDFNKLPEQFVLKCTHDSGGLVIVRDKNKMDKKAAKEKLTRSLKRNYYWGGREWPYKNVPRKIIAEKYMEEKNKIVPEDYKIYCMNDEPKYIVVFHNRFNASEKLSETVYDTNWVPQHISLDEHFAISDEVTEKPVWLDELLEITRKLCKDMIQVRIDFYVIENRIYFGEITLHTASGIAKMIPEELDAKLGEMVKISTGGGYALTSSGYTLYLRPQQEQLELKDYKFFCFNGKAKFLYLSQGLEHHDTAHISYVNLDWTQADFFRTDYKPFSKLPHKPANFEKMIELAECLSANIPFLRVDFYEIDKKIFFGELTFFTGSGFTEIEPQEWDKKLGDMLILPK